MDRAEAWLHIHRERRALAATLASLPATQWEHDTLCDGWTVHDIAAHVISHPQIRARHLPGMVARNLGRGYNAMVDREVRRWSAQRTREAVLAEYEKYDGSTRHVPGTTHLEALIDVLVHTQDVLRPLGLRHDMPPDAAAVAADRARVVGRLTGWHRAARGVRLVATDIGWAQGDGPSVEGPMQELLLVCTGRAKAATGLAGDGLPLVAGLSPR